MKDNAAARRQQALDFRDPGDELVSRKMFQNVESDDRLEALGGRLS